MILLVCAVAEELAWFERRPDVEVLVTGVGPVEAAARVAHSLCLQTFDLVVNAGLAGAFRGVANVGDGVVVTQQIYEINIENGDALRLPNDARTVERVRAQHNSLTPLILPEYRAVRGITVSRVTSSDATAQRLHALGAEVETMEGFAVLRAAQIAGISAVEVRGISNYVGDRATSEWNFAAGIAGLQRVTQSLFAAIERGE